MNIAVNTRLLLPQKLSGIGRFTFETLRRITRNHPEHTFFFLFDRAYSPDFIFADNIRPVVLPPQSRHPVLWYIWFEISLKRALKKINPDLFLSPDGYLSLASDIPAVPVIHDINFIHHPEFLPPLSRKYFNHFFPRYAQKAKKIATVSQFSKQDICRTYQIEKNKVEVVYNGVSEGFIPLTSEKKQAIKHAYTQGKDYFIFVGDLHPRKNLERLLKAFDAFKSETHSNIQFVIVGHPMFKTRSIERTFRAMRYQKEVIFTGRVSDAELKQLTASALAMLYVSVFEGFGIPILEAMSCETPVLCANTDAQAEIAGEAALQVDPLSVDAIKEGMKEIAFNQTLRLQLIESGNIRKLDFSWDKTAEKLWNIVEFCL